eukprot:TRINITY_DN2861_c4_g1_i1.p1 TRINITY_DN2861_c4_g1~~TRINITY_DN2861_c4_g1_i1.p1  ORF type:complete len:689 (+),score=67.83 TRINITY_DN2861_c4_g1_i1:50-2116(+)
MPAAPNRVRPDEVNREGMNGWSREKDNRMRELATKREAGTLLDTEELEYNLLHSENEKFIEAGLQFQRGEGIKTNESIIVLVGYAVGLGNMWRFPYLVGKFGGLSFIVAYAICLIFVAHPVYLLELAYGQTMRKSTVYVYREINPRWIGVGYTCVFALFLVQTYYSVLLSYCSVYLVNSFVVPLPWSREALGPYVPVNVTPAQYYWEISVLGKDHTGPAESLGEVQWFLVSGLLVSYGIIGASVYKGIAVSAKVTYFTVGLPVILICLLCIRSFFLEGAGTGLVFFIGRFDAVAFANPVMWAEACSQTLFTLLFLPGTSITLASYMRSKEDIYRINLIVIAINTAFSLVAGLTVFSIIGYVATQRCNSGDYLDYPGCTSDLVESLAKANGPGLAFVALAEGISTFGASSGFFSFVLFLMCYCLGLDTAFAGVETLVTYFEDYYLSDGKGKPGSSLGRRGLLAVVVTALFMTGLLFCTSGGFSLLDIVDHYVTTYTMLIVCSLECYMFAWDVTWEVLATNVQLATTGLLHINNGRGRELPRFIRHCLVWVAPCVCTLLLGTLFIMDCLEPYSQSDQDAYDTGFQVAGWSLMVATILIIPVTYFLQKHRQETAEAENEMAPRLLMDDVVVSSDCERSPYTPPPEVRTPASDPPIPTGKTAELRKQLEALGAEELQISEAALESTIGSQSE